MSHYIVFRNNAPKMTQITQFVIFYYWRPSWAPFLIHAYIDFDENISYKLLYTLLRKKIQEFIPIWLQFGNLLIFGGHFEF